MAFTAVRVLFPLLVTVAQISTNEIMNMSSVLEANSTSHQICIAPTSKPQSLCNFSLMGLILK